jgi:hypothetical protein
LIVAQIRFAALSTGQYLTAILSEVNRPPSNRWSSKRSRLLFLFDLTPAAGDTWGGDWQMHKLYKIVRAKDILHM